MLGAVIDTVGDLGVIAGFLAAVCTLGGLAIRWICSNVRRSVHEELAPIKAELHPNGGSSLRDRVDETADELHRMGVQVEHHGERLERIEDRLTGA